MKKVKIVFACGKSVILISIVVLGQPYIDRCTRFNLCYFDECLFCQFQEGQKVNDNDGNAL